MNDSPPAADVSPSSEAGQPAARALPRRVLAVGAHPDDIEILCAGTLARFVRMGCEVHLGIACRGDRGGSADPDLGARRRREAQGAAALLGAAGIEFLGLGDADVWDTLEVRRQFIALLRRARPELVITHGPNDYHADHVDVGQIVGKCAWFAASAGHIGEEEPLPSSPTVVYMDNIAAIDFEPSHLVDISETLELKRRMLACHASQIGREDSGMHGLDDLLVTQARMRGFQCGVRYAEAFRVAPLWGRRRPEPLFP